MRIQRAANWVVTRLLRSPLAGGPGRSLILLHVVGRKSGKKYDVPVAYVRDGDELVIGSPFGWMRNLRTGEPLAVHYLGRPHTADVVVHTAADAVAADYTVICRGNKQFASFNNIRLDATGNPDTGDLRAAWELGARSARLRIR
ncbi:DUF385 domain-containing protein [Nocardia stercoris]|uniref:DUF385 domain-containing protein n=2 Tax=Nocardia stercoris TaxID=2483361 RepID=A0A3M2L3B9_9NOCA|nr:DUF385 domain-containing protein [Nocardia stercoris]